MEVSQIKGRSSFETWLENRPKEWAQVLAVRAALRVAPLAWTVAALPDERLSKDHSNNLILSTFRACFISSVECKYPADDMSSVAEAANSYSASYNAETIPVTSYAAASAIAARAAFYAPSYAADAVANAARAADNWQSVREDCAWLEFSNNRYLDDDIPTYVLGNKHKTLAAELSRHSLWVKGFDERGKTKAADMPKYILAAFDQFANSELAQTTSFGFIADWYKWLNTHNGRVNPKNILTKDAELAIATMSRDDWGDNDKERDCVEVMDRVAAIVGWERKKPLLDSNWDFFISYNENDEVVAKRISNILEEEGHSVFSQFNDMTVGKSFVQEMNKGLEGMGRMIAVYSPDYFSSGPCVSEWEAAYLTDTDGSKGNIIPFLVKACSPPPLARRIIWKSLQGLNSEQERKAVLAAIDKADVPKTRVAMRNALKETSSPDIVSDATDEKLDAVPNKKFDTPFVEEELLDLPEILRSLIDTLLAGVEQTNCPPTLKQALKAYSKELSARGANCILGVLRAQMDVIELGLSSEQAEYWCSDETLIGAFEKIREYHLQLITHYPLDQTRQRLVNAIDVAPEKLNGENFDGYRREIIKATADAHEAGEVTDRYRDITENQLTVARDVLDVATPDFSQSDDKEFDLKERDRIARIEDAKKRRLTDVVGTADKSLEVMTKMTKLAESETAKNLLNALKRLGDWFW